MGRRKTVLEEVNNGQQKSVDFNVGDLEGIGPKKQKKLEEAGVKTPLDIVIMGSQEITQVTEIDKDDAIRLVDKVRLQLEEQGIIPKLESASDVLAWRSKIFMVSTGSEALDEILNGGVPSQAITEAYGPDGAGKTQLLNTLTVNALNNKQAVLYIDCEGTFSQERLTEIATVRGFYREDLFNELYYARTLDTDILEKVVKGMVKKIIDKNIKLIIIDGAPGLYRSEYDRGQAELSRRQNDIKPVARHLRNIADYLNVSIVMSNQVIGDPNGKYTGEEFKPVGGFVFNHVPKYIIRLSKAYKNKRAARLIKCPYRPIADVVFYLNAEGISDYEDLTKKKPKETISEELTKSLIDESVLLAVGNDSNLQG